MDPGRDGTAGPQETTTMDLAHAIVAGGLAARAADRRDRGDVTEISEARTRALARRTAAVQASARVEYRERGRHAAPGSAQPRPAGA
jgi:hypothetical protein